MRTSSSSRGWCWSWNRWCGRTAPAAIAAKRSSFSPRKAGSRLPTFPITPFAIEILPDDRALRAGGRERALAQMEKHDLDVLVLGRQANVRYVSGAPQLWVAGTRPFGPTCVVIRETGAIHLLSTWDEGVPDDIPHENLYGITWNPMNTISALQRIDGAAAARRGGAEPP